MKKNNQSINEEKNMESLEKGPKILDEVPDPKGRDGAQFDSDIEDFSS